MTYDNKKNPKSTVVDYRAAKTVGFYQLGNTLRNLTEPSNTYIMVSDANAPTPLFEPLDDADNATLAKSIFLFNDDSIFD